ALFLQVRSTHGCRAPVPGSPEQHERSHDRIENRYDERSGDGGKLEGQRPEYREREENERHQAGDGSDRIQDDVMEGATSGFLNFLASAPPQPADPPVYK